MPRTSSQTETHQIPATVLRLADLTFLGGAVLSGLLVVPAVSGPGRPLLDYGVLLAWGAGSIACLRLRSHTRVNVALLIWSLLGSIYLAEVLLVFLQGVPAASPLFDGRTLLEVIRDLRRKGIEAYPAFPFHESHLTIDGSKLIPLGGVANKTVVFCNEAGQYIQYETDEHGFRNPRGIWEMPIDIAVVGDSFTQGFCVPSDHDLVAPLRRRYPATLNLGMSGNGPLLELAAIREYLTVLRPRITLWVYFENDLMELEQEKLNPLLLRYLEPGVRGGLIEKQLQIDQALAALLPGLDARARRWPPALERLGLRWQLLPLWIHDLVVGPGVTRTARVIKLWGVRQLMKGVLSRDSATAPDFALFRRILAVAKDAVHSWNGEFYLVYLPGWHSVIRSGADGLRNRTNVLEVAKALGIPVIDVYSPMSSHADPASLFSSPGSHYNRNGYAAAGGAILDALRPPRP